MQERQGNPRRGHSQNGRRTVRWLDEKMLAIFGEPSRTFGPKLAYFPQPLGRFFTKGTIARVGPHTELLVKTFRAEEGYSRSNAPGPLDLHI